ncbi:hypothetical protein HS088_TW13G00491 [Tripterygium wilfordii]|uniref:Late embryogenesis abundant protein LEA-2 subgroup domain-containing protein n=1 Tax=Tripterygium wilfordii TaxID=458696 RepID=A0A7J7CU00_TRIWF|nr:uncharacterized protein LOC120012431 [Tripterygium wilfordii]KAF5737605.1 hypothetical protein HS088_TW13G00491 [Tripterygium wilfordii]
MDPYDDEEMVAVGYPYYHVHQLNQPPPSPSHASSNQPRSTLIKCTKGLLCFLIPVFTILIFFLGVKLFFISQLSDPKVRVDSISVNLSSGEMSSNWDITFFLRNPNRFSSISYKMTVVSVLDQGKRRVGLTVADSYHLDAGKNGSMKARASVLSLKKMKAANERSVEAAHAFSLKVEAMVLIKIKYLDEQWYLMEASCKDLMIRSMTHSSKKLMVMNGSNWCTVNFK